MTISVIRTIVLYLLLMAAMRLMGKRQLGELQPSELVVTLLLSDLAAVPMQENGLPLLNGILPILVLVSLELLISGLMLKFPLVNKWVSGSPIPIIRDGMLDAAALRRLRMTVEDLEESLRQQNVFDLRQVQYALVETNGHVSAFCYPSHQPATAADAGAQPPDTGLPVVVVSDGVLCDWGMQLCGLSEEALARYLRKKQCAQEEVFLLTATKNGPHHLLTRADVKGGHAVKRLYIALVLLAAVATLCVYTHLYQHNAVDRMLTTLDTIEDAARRGDTAYALAQAEAFAATYEQVSDRISCYVSHSELRESRETAALLPALLEKGVSEELYMEIFRLRSQLRYIRQVDDPILRNIL